MSGSSIESFKFFGMRVSFRNAKIFAAAEREAKSGARERKPLEREKKCFTVLNIGTRARGKRRHSGKRSSHLDPRQCGEWTAGGLTPRVG